MGTTLEQLNADARQHCDGCERCDVLKESSAICGGKLVSFVNGLCPRGLWDHSAKIEHKPKASAGFVEICMGRHLEWPVKAWERIQACPLHGRKYRVPRALFNEIRDQWQGGD